jgi:phosphocarrier protein HPr
MSQVAEEVVEVTNSQGLHIRASGEVVRTAIGFLSDITIAHGTEVVSARSIVALTTMGVGIGARLTIRAKGPDAAEAVKAIAALFHAKFGEV